MRLSLSSLVSAMNFIAETSLQTIVFFVTQFAPCKLCKSTTGKKVKQMPKHWRLPHSQITCMFLAGHRGCASSPQGPKGHNKLTHLPSCLHGIPHNAGECKVGLIWKHLRPSNRAKRALLTVKCSNVVQVLSHDNILCDVQFLAVEKPRILCTITASAGPTGL